MISSTSSFLSPLPLGDAAVITHQMVKEASSSNSKCIGPRDEYDQQSMVG